MKKTLLVTAIAAVISGPVAAMETDFYGNIRLSLRSSNTLGVDSSKLVIGWKGSEDLGNGMTASYKLELEHDDPNTKNGSWENDRSWVALGGDFGKVVLGREDTFDGYANAGTDIFAINGGHGYFAGNELENGFQYRGGSGAFKFGVGAEMFGSGGTQAGADTDFMNTTYGISFEGDNFQIGAHGADVDINSALTGMGAQSSTGGGNYNVQPGDTALNVGGYYTFGNFTLGVTIGDNGSAANSDVTDIVLAFPLGSCGALVGIASGDALDAAAALTPATGTGGDIMNLGYNCSSGAAYYGFEYNDDDNATDAVAIGYYGVKF